MAYYATADLHGNLPPIPSDAELLLIAGDICPDFRPSNATDWVDKEGHFQAAWLDKDFRAWLDTRPVGCDVVAIWGNHDFVGERPALVPELPWTLLRDDSLQIRGLHIYGTPWVPGLPYWAFYATDEALVHRAAAIPSGLDVLMTHGPPLGAGDFIPGSPKQIAKYGNRDGQHVGDVNLCGVLRFGRPKLTVCGHIHEGRGTYALHGRDVWNVAAVNERYVLHDNPWIEFHI